MNYLIRETDNFYNRMLFKEALRTGFFEYQDARDKYREMIGGHELMNKKLILKFLETQALILSPICPHASEAMYALIKGSDDVSVFNASFPEVPESDESLRKSYEFLINSIHDFRIRLKNFMVGQSKTAKKGSAPVVPVKPTHATIYVAKKFPQWQQLIMDKMHDLYRSKGNQLPENKELASELAKISELKKYMKKVMPFAETRKQMLAKNGVSVFEQTSPFDEAQVLRDNLSYLTTALELQELDVKAAEESDKAALKDECCPMEPVIEFRIQ